MKKQSLFTLLFALFLASCLLITACGITGETPGQSQSPGGDTDNSPGNPSVTPGDKSENSHPGGTSGEVSYPDELYSDGHFSQYDLNTSYSAADTSITLKDGDITVAGPGAVAENNTVTIGSPGVYVLSGTLSDGQIIVSVAKSEKVRLIFSGVNLHCSYSAPVWIKSADKTVITLARGTENVLTDSASYKNLNANDEPNACLFSKDDLTVNGMGSLTVTGKYNNGICSKDDLKIISGKITVTAKNNGLKGNDSVSVAGGDITVISSDDGIKTTNESKEDKGFIYIRDGTILIKSGDDGLQATRAVTVTGGKLTIQAGGKTVNCKGTVNIAQGTLVK